MPKTIVLVSCLIGGVILQNEIHQEATKSQETPVNGKSTTNSFGLNSSDAVVLQDTQCQAHGGLRVTQLLCIGPTGTLDCDDPLPLGAIVMFQCPPHHHADSKVSTCMSNGQWSIPIECYPECGIVAQQATPLVMHGLSATQGQFPWVAAYYLLKDGQWSYSCSGTLITDNVVITAAHCTWNQEKENMLIALGHIERVLPEVPENVFKIKRVYMLPVFREATNYYNSDIAILVLESAAQLSENILPACLLGPETNNSLSPDTWGVVAGWGIDENRLESDNLHYINAPIIDTVKCLEHVPKPFTKYIAYTSFCAGYTNGTGVCNGDSGAGLLTETDGRWVLQGVVSLSPSGGARYCHTRSYSLYTKVSLYMDWIHSVLAFEDNKTLMKN